MDGFPDVLLSIQGVFMSIHDKVFIFAAITVNYVVLVSATETYLWIRRDWWYEEEIFGVDVGVYDGYVYDGLRWIEWR